MTWTDAGDPQRYGAGILQGERIRLRALEEADLPDLVRWWRDPEGAVLQQLTVRPRPEGDVAEMWRKWSDNEPAGAVGFCVTDRISGRLVGHVTLFGAKLLTRAATLTVMIGSEHTGSGYGTDAVRTLVDYGFREMGLNRIELHVFAYNARARATYRKVGFVEEGVLRETVFHDGAFHDEVVMSVLARDWFATAS
ncbi:GNAT family N-acetyltransferase [Clavibacter sp. VKM Ac-2872]|uniref:GNAT family N-acetyltransferase n=1 Tax=Clavibacter sp. VKM Ac-2872 TaxID=2783812 RepID=UPI00188A1699|nr:GNAT family protein [Clavibacter sp. VKM Ac-2872]MBF4622714.1 GNAT family N-acetyltransferase [Clavibacter sp. VKM Ac-2872]